MKLIKNKHGLLHFEFSSRKEITMTMGRAQEFYESCHKHLRNRVFTLEMFLDTFTNDDGVVSYFDSWSGFNIPGQKLNEFFQKFYLTTREKKLLDAVYREVAGHQYYVIATIAGDGYALAHENIHAAWTLNATYRKAALRLVKGLNPKLFSSLKSILVGMGYSPTVVHDEINAYLSTSTLRELKQTFGVVFSKEDVKPFVSLAKEQLERFGD